MESEFPGRLRRLRERRRMNRKAMGECCGLSKNIIGMYERGEKEPTLPRRGWRCRTLFCRPQNDCAAYRLNTPRQWS